MAGDWLKWGIGLCQKREVLEISARLNIPPTQAAGTLMLVMEWVDSNVTSFDGSGHASVLFKSGHYNILDSVIGVAGFTDAMIEVGWMSHKEGVLTFVNAGRHNGKSAKARALNTENRASNRRLVNVPIETGQNKDTSSLLSDSVKGSVRGKRTQVKLSDAEFIQALKVNPEYSGIDIDIQHGKAEAWCIANNRTCSRRMFTNWLNRAERPMGASGSPGPFKDPYRIADAHLTAQ